MLVLRGLIHLSGVTLYAHYSGCDPLTTTKYPLKPVMILTQYVLTNLTSIPGLTGLFVASIYAAVLRLFSNNCSIVEKYYY